jgi:hypothetical protein
MASLFSVMLSAKHMGTMNAVEAVKGAARAGVMGHR